MSASSDTVPSTRFVLDERSQESVASMRRALKIVRKEFVKSHHRIDSNAPVSGDKTTILASYFHIIDILFQCDDAQIAWSYLRLSAHSKHAFQGLISDTKAKETATLDWGDPGSDPLMASAVRLSLGAHWLLDIHTLWNSGECL